MKRLSRNLISGAVVLSLLLCVALAALWVRSLYRYDELVRSGRGSELWIIATRGSLAVQTNSGIMTDPQPWWRFNTRPSDEGKWSYAENGFNTWYNRAGFIWLYTSNSSNGRSSAWLVLPLWFLAMMTALPAVAWWVTRWRRRRRRSTGLCAHCGYDLRATPDRCPECGAQATPLPAR